MGSTAHLPLHELPGSEDDPNPGASLYWMVFIFVVTAVFIFFGTYLAKEFVIAAETGEKAHAPAPELTPQRRTELQERLDGKALVWDVDELNLAHDLELQRTLKGDQITLPNGRVINHGRAVTRKVSVKDGDVEKDEDREFIVDARGNPLLGSDGKELVFRPGELKIRTGEGRPLTLPLSEGFKAAQAALGKGTR